MNTKVLEHFDGLDSDFLSTVAGGAIFNTIYMGPPQFQVVRMAGNISVR